jgi:hypothetical protein
MDEPQVREVLENVLLYDEYRDKFTKLKETEDLTELSELEQENLQELFEVEFISQMNGKQKPFEEREKLRQAYRWLQNEYEFSPKQKMKNAIEIHVTENNWSDTPMTVVCYNCGLETNIQETSLYSDEEETAVISNRHYNNCPECGKQLYLFLCEDEYETINSKKDVFLYNLYSQGFRYLPILMIFLSIGVVIVGQTQFKNTVIHSGVFGSFVFSILLFVGIELYLARHYEAWERPVKYRRVKQEGK